jgi:hypothetical protein
VDHFALGCLVNNRHCFLCLFACFFFTLELRDQLDRFFDGVIVKGILFWSFLRPCAFSFWLT